MDDSDGETTVGETVDDTVDDRVISDTVVKLIAALEERVRSCEYLSKDLTEDLKASVVDNFEKGRDQPGRYVASDRVERTPASYSNRRACQFMRHMCTFLLYWAKIAWGCEEDELQMMVLKLGETPDSSRYHVFLAANDTKGANTIFSGIKSGGYTLMQDGMDVRNSTLPGIGGFKSDLIRMFKKLYRSMAFFEERSSGKGYWEGASERDMGIIAAIFKVFKATPHGPSLTVSATCDNKFNPIDPSQPVVPSILDTLQQLNPDSLHCVHGRPGIHAEQRFIEILQCVTSPDGLVAGTKRPCLGCYALYRSTGLPNILGCPRPGNVWKGAMLSALQLNICYCTYAESGALSSLYSQLHGKVKEKHLPPVVLERPGLRQFFQAVFASKQHITKTPSKDRQGKLEWKEIRAATASESGLSSDGCTEGVPHWHVDTGTPINTEPNSATVTTASAAADSAGSGTPTTITRTIRCKRLMIPAPTNTQKRNREGKY
ncbi:hypothetical protein Pelo_6459 [Pelomyxa schiedti]|nr:hypothetical protein Pelo_6459 [Pelomyxa schiedti]